MVEFTAHSPAELQEPAAHLAKLLQTTRICTIDGEMGSGKTTLVSAICKSMGTSESAGSPTFSIVNEYLYSGGKIYHFDLYRLTDEAELWDTGFEDYLYSGEICLIEWPDLAKSFLAGMEKVEVQIRREGEKRVISINQIS